MFSSDIDVKNHADLWDKWRSYEAKMAVDQIKEAGTFAFFFGKGLGGLIDLKIDYLIPGIPEKQIPILHNGYAFIYYKSGILGLLFYLLLIFILYSKVYSNNNGNPEIVNRLISGFGIYFMLSTLIVTGIYNVNSPLPLFLGFVIGIDRIIKQTNYENSNIGNKGDS